MFVTIIVIMFIVVVLWVVITLKAKVFNEAYDPIANSHGFENIHDMARSIGFRNMVEYENMFKSHGVTDKHKIAQSIAYDYDLQVVKGLSGAELEHQAKYDAKVQIITDITGLSKTQWESLSKQEQKDTLNSPDFIKQQMEFWEKLPK